ncbi:MAG: PAS domain S-box protein [Actinomycetota bacterium]|nr:PAS domain S-box protein [Actinomycetota bacterium]
MVVAVIAEFDRLAELASYDVLDTAPEPEFDEIVQTAAEIAGCSTALVSLLDEDRQWFKARCGLDVPHTPRDQAFCEHVLRADAALIVPDATADPRFWANPLVTGPPRIRFYAGFPLRTPTGAVLGTLCVLGYEPRPQGLTDGQQRLLRVLASQVMTQLELRRALALQQETVRDLGLALGTYRALADHATDVVSKHLPDGTTLYVSPSIRSVLGYDPDGEIGRSAPERVHPDDAPRMREAMGAVLSGSPATATVRSRHADGTWRHLEIHLSPVRDETGGVAQIHSAARDVGERHEAEQRLRLSEERFRVLFDANPVGQVEMSAGGVVQRVNQAFADLVGVDPETLVGLTPEWATAEQDRPAQEVAVQSATSAPGTVLYTERTLRRSDGSDVEIAGTVVGVPDDDGRTTILIGSAIDVTARNQAQRRLVELSDELRIARDEAVRRHAFSDTVLQTLRVGIVVCDAEGRLTTFNGATREFHGMPADPTVDPAHWADRYALYNEDGVTPLRRDQVPLLRALTDGNVEGAVIVIAPDGLPARTVRCDGRAMRDPDGRLLGAVVAMSDITQARSTAKALAEHAEYTRVLLENAHAAIWSCDVTGRPTFINPTAQEVLGWPDLDTLTGLFDRGELAHLSTAVEILHPDGAAMDAAERPLARALAGEHTGEIEVLLSAPGRPTRSLLLQASPLRDSAGAVSGALLTGHDVTALRASEARFRAAFHDGPTPVARLDRHGVVLEANPALRRLTSLRQRNLVGQKLTHHVAADDRRRLQRVLAGPGTGAQPAELRLLRADGTGIWCELATTVTVEPDGSVSVLAQFLDVHARKLQELSLERAARRDPLTGLANRTELVTRIRKLLDGPAGTTAGLLFLDLDGFKAVNDTHGHDAGDAILVEVADRLVAAVRPDDAVLRLGGDEFLVICPVPLNAPEAPMQALAERLERAISLPIKVRGITLTVGGSVGVAVGRRGQTPQEIVDAADRSMYQRKHERLQPTES